MRVEGLGADREPSQREEEGKEEGGKEGREKGREEERPSRRVLTWVRMEDGSVANEASLGAWAY